MLLLFEEVVSGATSFMQICSFTRRLIKLSSLIGFYFLKLLDCFLSGVCLEWVIVVFFRNREDPEILMRI